LQFALAFAAIHGGGTIKFNCGRAPVIITLTDTLTIPNNTTIDGGGLITLSRSSTSLVEDLILVDHGSTAILKSLAFNRAGNTAGFALFSEGTLTIKDSTFSENFVTVLNEGTLTVISTTFSDNGSFVAVGAIWNKGTLHVKNSLFSHNVAGSGGGILSDGTLSVENSTFVQNEKVMADSVLVAPLSMLSVRPQSRRAGFPAMTPRLGAPSRILQHSPLRTPSSTESGRGRPTS